MMRSDEVNFYTYLYYQRVHKKKLVNGASPGTKAWDFFKKVNNISNPRTKNISELTYNNGNFPIIPYGLELYKDFGKDKVYIFK